MLELIWGFFKGFFFTLGAILGTLWTIVAYPIAQNQQLDEVNAFYVEMNSLTVFIVIAIIVGIFTADNELNHKDKS